APAGQRVPEDDAMGSDSRKRDPREGREVAADTIERVMRERVRDTIERIVAEELEAALGAARSARVGEARAGYRHGTRSRTLTTSLGPTTITMPRARLATDDGGMTEWASAAVPRYQRRTARVDEAIPGVYLSGGHRRRPPGGGTRSTPWSLAACGPPCSRWSTGIPDSTRRCARSGPASRFSAALSTSSATSRRRRRCGCGRRSPRTTGG